MLLPVPCLQSQCFSPHPIRKVPRATLVLLFNGDWDCILLSIARANLQAPKSNAGPNARGSRGSVLFSSACMLDMAACCRLTRDEGRNRGSRLEHGAVAAAKGHTWCNRQGKWLRRSAAWLRFLGSLRPTHVAPSFFRNRPFRREISPTMNLRCVCDRFCVTPRPCLHVNLPHVCERLFPPLFPRACLRFCDPPWTCLQVNSTHYTCER